MQAKGDVLQRRLVREKHVLLEYETDRAKLRGGVRSGSAQYVAVEPDLAGLDSFETRRHAQQRALAAAGNAEQAGNLARFGRKRDPIEDLVLAVAVAYAPELQAHGAGSIRTPRRVEGQVASTR